MIVRADQLSWRCGGPSREREIVRVVVCTEAPRSSLHAAAAAARQMGRAFLEEARDARRAEGVKPHPLGF